MEVGLIGLPYVGKTTLFTALTAGTGSAPDTSAAAAGKPIVGVVNIPDPRLQLIASFIETQKIVPATLKITDIPGIAPGDSHASRLLAHVRDVDALCHVVRCFEGGLGAPNPKGDMENLQTELILADLQVVENALPKAERAAKARDPEAVARLSVLQKVKPVLDEGKPISTILSRFEGHDAAELRAMKGMSFLTAKKTLYVANVSENDVADAGKKGPAAEVFARAKSEGMECIAVCAKIEAELSELSEADRREMLESFGLKEPALPALAHGLQRLLGLMSFYTAGPKEVRAWTIHLGDTAPLAAGAIHSDIERGFIRAEIYSVDDLAHYKSEKAIKEAGKLRTEGKSYVMRDGDVCHFLFNV